jgi:hypothetical protein
MFNKIRFLLIALVLLTTACAPKFANSAFCQQAAVNHFEKSGGPSAPIELTLTDNQIVVIDYTAQWDKGKVNFEIWDDAGIPVWNAPAQKTSTALTIKSTPLKAGAYRLLNIADDATDGTICMNGKAQ